MYSYFFFFQSLVLFYEMCRGRNRRLAHERHTKCKAMASNIRWVSIKLIFLMKIFVNKLKEESLNSPIILTMKNRYANNLDNEKHICK